MKDPLDEIELELRRLQPAKPEPALTRRIESELGESGVQEGRSVWWSVCAWWVPIAGVAVLAVGAVLFRGGHSLFPVSPSPEERSALQRLTKNQAPSSGATRTRRSPVSHLRTKLPLAEASAAFHQVNSANYLIGTEDDGVVYASASTPLRKVRCQFLTTTQWKAGKDNTTVEVIVPGEETVLIPMNVH